MFCPVDQRPVSAGLRSLSNFGHSRGLIVCGCVTVLCVGLLGAVPGTVDHLHLFAGPVTEGLVCLCVCVSLVFGLWSGTDCFNLSSKQSGWNGELLLNSRFLLRQSWDYPPLKRKASAFLGNLSSQPPSLRPFANTQRWPVTHNADVQRQVTLQELCNISTGLKL